jgi:NADH:ubiquinone reductase (H+-translocating)
MEIPPLRDYDDLRDAAARAKPHVVIVGGGFAGLYCALGLRDQRCDVTIVDQHNHHLFQPLLYQVATAALAAPDIAAPIRRIVKDQDNARVLLDRVIAVDRAAKRVRLEAGTIGYDTLVLAPGAVDHYFGHDDWARHAHGLKSLDDAFRIRSRILESFEAAERESDPALRREHLTFVVVGGGPTGVELAGSVAEIARKTLTRNFRNFDPSGARVVLLEGGERILASYSAESSASAQQQLERIGAEVRTGARVDEVTARGVRIGGEWIASRTVLWAAGVRASPLCASLDTELDRQGRVLVAADLTVPNDPAVFVLGDAAAVKSGDSWVPGVAPAAIQMGSFCAKAIASRLRGESPAPFVYRDKGSLATIGRRAAVAEIGRWRSRGAVAWMLWLFIHVFFLIGFRNRLAVMIEWGIAYLTYQRSARVILTRSRGG